MVNLGNKEDWERRRQEQRIKRKPKSRELNVREGEKSLSLAVFSFPALNLLLSPALIDAGQLIKLLS